MDPTPIWQAPEPRLVLASTSPARAALLEACGLAFETRPPAVDETAVLAALRAEGARAEDAAVLLAELKARSVSARVTDEDLVLGADQILEVEGSWLEKPADVAAARAQLSRLRGRAHRLVTAVVALRAGARIWHAVDAAELVVRPFSDAFLDAYLARCGPTVLVSCGAYRLEAEGAHLMAEVRGDQFTIRGLPLLPLLAFLRDQRVLLA
ncbi:MAG: Maf family protein [Geminicoccaceae bacterium]|nr:Maf family protein [Geminicoccaceae bacterium]